ncbi:MAG: lipoyl(octanoyl) transferase LipB [Balneolaceae bacterium]
MNKVDIYDLGRAPYRETWELQKSIQNRLVEEKLKARDDPAYSSREHDVLLFVEHPHVYTLGKSGNAANMLKGLAELRQLDAEFIENDRGGDITYHGPGQIVGYPILDLGRYFTDIHKYLRFLEEVIIRVCSEFGLQAGRIDGLTGVWVDNRKICAMGIRCSRWVTMHGFALNVNTDLSYFDHIIPCGISDKSVSSLSELCGRMIDENEVKEFIVKHFSDIFSAEAVQGGKLPDYDRQFS